MFHVTVLQLPDTALLLRKPVQQLFAAAKQIIAKAWQTHTLNLAQVKARMYSYVVHAKMTAMFRDRMSQFKREYGGLELSISSRGGLIVP